MRYAVGPHGDRRSGIAEYDDVAHRLT